MIDVIRAKNERDLKKMSQKLFSCADWNMRIWVADNEVLFVYPLWEAEDVRKNNSEMRMAIRKVNVISTDLRKSSMCPIESYNFIKR